MVATSITYAGQTTVSGTVTAIAGDASTVTLETSTGQPLTLATTLVGNLLVGLETGDAVDATYSPDPGGFLVPHALQIIGAPSPQYGGSPSPPGPQYGGGP
jgi:hypothetical protein